MSRKLVSSGSYLEPVIGFSRAVRVGNIVAVGGTAPIRAEGGTAAIGDAYGQTRRCLEIIAKALADVGSSLEHVIRTRIILTDIALGKDAARAHASPSPPFGSDHASAGHCLRRPGLAGRDRSRRGDPRPSV